VETIDLKGFHELDKHENLSSTCKALYKTDNTFCNSCEGHTYTLKTIKKGDVVSVDGKILLPGNYCIKTTIPDCDTSKGVLIVDANDTYDCICKYPEFFNGPSCNTKVACVNNFQDGYLVDKTGTKIDASADVNFYEVGAHCVCDTLHTETGLKLTSLGDTECVIDPCLYPLPFPEEDAKGYDRGACTCGTILKNQNPNEIRSPCSSCLFEFKDNFATIPFNCYNQYQFVQSISTLYPCLSLRDPSNCGTAQVQVKKGENYLEGANNKLSEIAILT
jgi:hypothetical protein